MEKATEMIEECIDPAHQEKQRPRELLERGPCGYVPRCSRSSRPVATRARSEQSSTIVTSTSAPAHAWRCQSSYGEIA